MQKLLPETKHGTTRGQAQTLGVFFGTAALISVLIFTHTLTAQTLHEETSTQRIIDNEHDRVQTTLHIAHTTGTAKTGILNYDTTNTEFNNTDSEPYYTNPTPTDRNALLEHIETTLDTERITYNINLHYYKPGSNTATTTKRFLYVGSPPNGTETITANQRIAIHDDDTLTGTSQTVSDASNFYAPESTTSTSIHNTVRIEVIAWQT